MDGQTGCAVALTRSIPSCLSQVPVAAALWLLAGQVCTHPLHIFGVCSASQGSLAALCCGCFEGVLLGRGARSNLADP